MRFAVYAVGFVTLLIIITYSVGSKYQVKTIRNKFYERYKSIASQLASTSTDLILKGNDLDLENLDCRKVQNLFHTTFVSYLVQGILDILHIFGDKDEPL